MVGSNEPDESTPLPYTSSPIELLRGELALVKDILLYYPASLPGILLPFWSSNPEDELCLLNPKNVRSLLLHLILILAQFLFLVALPVVLFFPVPAFAVAYLAGIATFMSLNYLFCKLLNGDGSPHTSTTDLSQYPTHDKECWIFINGVSVGRDWFQSNLNVLSSIFRRPILGVHNITYGIIFDVLECLIQRDACYPTNDIRTGYATVKKSMLDDRYDKIVLIAHSQGGIEAGAILDWLLADLPSDKLAKLEIYTFGSAANHFNNPSRPGSSSYSPTSAGLIKHIEHYTNSGDFVCQFGILGFIRRLTASSPAQNSSPSKNAANNTTTTTTTNKTKHAATNGTGSGTGSGTGAEYTHNRFRGRLFKRNATGHMLNQHYLAYLFPRQPCRLPDGSGPGERVKDSNPFMDGRSSAWDTRPGRDGLGWGWSWGWGGHGEGEEVEGEKGKEVWRSMVVEDGVDLSGAGAGAGMVGRRPRELSRLWGYRNGGVPGEGGEEGGEEGEEEGEEEGAEE